MTAAHDPAECRRLVSSIRSSTVWPEGVSAEDAASMADQLEAACGEVERLTRTVQRESGWVNELQGVLAFIVGALHEVMRSGDLEAAKTCAELAAQNLAEYHAGTWKPGPTDDPADWRARR